MRALQGSITSSAISVQGPGCVLLSSTHRTLSLIAALFMVLTISLQGSISPLLCPCVYVILCVASTRCCLDFESFSVHLQPLQGSISRHGPPWLTPLFIDFILRSPSVFAAYPSQGSIHWGPDSTDSVCPRPHFQGSIPFPVSRVLYHFCISYTFY